ncbi:unnamed protein product [Ectocarpus fasciculatus]
MSMVGWTAEGGVGTTSHERGGDAIVEALRAVAYTEPPDQWSGRDERKGREGAEGGQGHRQDGASGRNNGGGARFGREHQWVRRVDSKSAAEKQRDEDAHVCSDDDPVCGRGRDGLKWRRKGRGGGGGWGEGGSEGTASGGERSDGCSADGEGHASKKRRTPSPDPARKSSLAAEDAADSAMGSSAGGAAAPRPREANQPTTVEEKAAAEDRALREAEVIRWCQRVSSPRAMSGDGGTAAAGPDENFFAGRVLDPVPARHRPGTVRNRTGGSNVSDAVVGWGVAETAASSSPPPCLGFGVGDLGGDGRGGDDSNRSGSGSSGGTDAASGLDQCPSSRDEEEAMAGVATRATSLPTAKCNSRSPLAAGFAGAALASSATSGEAATAAAAAGAAAAAATATGSGRPTPSAREQEGFFASHTLEPSARMSWILAAGEERPAGGETQGLGASGTALPEPAHGISPDSQRSGDADPGAAGSGSERREGHNPLCWTDTAGRYPPFFEEGAGAAAVADTGSSGGANDWQVRPEAMAGFFTTVGRSAYSPAVLLHSHRRPSPPRVRSPPAIGPAASAGVGIHPPPAAAIGPAAAAAVAAAAAGRVAKPPTADSERRQQVLGYSPVCGSGGGGGGGGGGTDGTPPATVAAAAATREGTVLAVSRTSGGGSVRDSSSVSSGWDVGSAGGGAAGDESGKEEEGDNSWGW